MRRSRPGRATLCRCSAVARPPPVRRHRVPQQTCDPTAVRAQVVDLLEDAAGGRYRRAMRWWPACLAAAAAPAVAAGPSSWTLPVPRPPQLAGFSERQLGGFLEQNVGNAFGALWEA